MNPQLPQDSGHRWKNIGARIRAVRIRAGLAQREVGEVVGAALTRTGAGRRER